MDARKRNLLILGAAALILIALAGLSLHRQQRQTSHSYAAQTFFPGFARHIREVAHIHIASKAHGAFDIAFDPQRGWVIPSRNNYPAAFDRVQHTLVGLATLQTIEPKTARPDWLSYLGLDSPSTGGKGVLIEALDEKGAVLASLIAGNSVDIGDVSGQTGLYIRKPDSTQSYLARGVLEPASDPADWMDKTVMDIDHARIREVDVAPTLGTPYTVLRDKPSDADFHLASVPRGREALIPSPADDVASAITGFVFDDISAAKNFDFSNASRVTVKTFDGLTVTVALIRQGVDNWAEVEAEAAPGNPGVGAEARTIDAHADGWAYKLPAYKAQQFMISIESLLKPATPAKAKP
jgi:hypothetical protein